MQDSIRTGEDDYEEDKHDDNAEEGSSKAIDASKQCIGDENASEIFDKLTKLQGKKTYYAKKNWIDDEAKLLQWAIQKYCRGKGITP